MMTTYEQNFINEKIDYQNLVEYIQKEKLTDKILFGDCSGGAGGFLRNSPAGSIIAQEFIQYLDSPFFVNSYKVSFQSDGRGITEIWKLRESPQHGFIDLKMCENTLFFKNNIYDNSQNKLDFFEWLSQKLDKSILELCFEIKPITVERLNAISIEQWNKYLNDNLNNRVYSLIIDKEEISITEQIGYFQERTIESWSLRKEDKDNIDKYFIKLLQLIPIISDSCFSISCNCSSLRAIHDLVWELENI